MNRLVMSVAVSAVCSCLAIVRAEAQTAEDLVGTWTLVSATVQAGEVKMDVYGPDPRGTLMFGSDGGYALVFMRRDLPKLTYNTRMSQTVEESRAITKGSIAHFGTYRVDEDEAGKALVLRIEGSTFPNWAGTEQHRPFSLSGDELTYTSPGSVGVATQIVVRRAK
jgi:Lipocalin-like domain